jgi:hypothetical protein
MIDIIIFIYITGLTLSSFTIVDVETVIGKAGFFKLVLWISLSWIAPVLWIYSHKTNKKLTWNF